jgi:hypothetical protein
MTDKKKIRKIEQILNDGKSPIDAVLATVKKEIKDKFHFDVDLNPDGTVERYWYNDRPTRKPRSKKKEAPKADGTLDVDENGKIIDPISQQPQWLEGQQAWGDPKPTKTEEKKKKK